MMLKSQVWVGSTDRFVGDIYTGDIYTYIVIMFVH